MPPIRNSCVARGVVAASTGTVIYTVPPNTVLLCKSVLYEVTTSGGIAALFYVNAPGLVAIPFIANPTPTSGTATLWEGWIALNAGDTITAICTGSAMDYWVSGALLPFVPGF